MDPLEKLEQAIVAGDMEAARAAYEEMASRPLAGVGKPKKPGKGAGKPVKASGKGKAGSGRGGSSQPKKTPRTAKTPQAAKSPRVAKTPRVAKPDPDNLFVDDLTLAAGDIAASRLVSQYAQLTPRGLRPSDPMVNVKCTRCGREFPMPASEAAVRGRSEDILSEVSCAACLGGGRRG